jgi:hypothetical protein
MTANQSPAESVEHSPRRGPERDWDLLERVQSLEEKRLLDNLVFARQQEELDGLANERSEDRFVITGIYIPGFYRLREMEARIAKMKSAVQSVVDLVMGDGNLKAEFVTQVNRSSRSGPVVINVRMQNAEAARNFRTTFAKKMKDYNKDGSVPNELRGVNVHPVQRLATRVRIDVLRSLADVIKEDSDDRVSAYVISHIPKPVMKVEIRMKEKTYTRTFSYTEAIEYVRLNHDSKLKTLKLHQAYARAGSSFRGSMEQIFVVMK